MCLEMCYTCFSTVVQHGDFHDRVEDVLHGLASFAVNSVLLFHLPPTMYASVKMWKLCVGHIYCPCESQRMSNRRCSLLPGGVPGIELRPSGLHGKCLLPIEYHTGHTSGFSGVETLNLSRKLVEWFFTGF